MSDYLHWHGSPSELKETPQCCRSVFDKLVIRLHRERDEQQDRALRDEHRRIVAALTDGIEAWERNARSFAAGLGDLGPAVIESAVKEVRHLLAAAGCTCPQINVTQLSDSKPRYVPGMDRYCAVHT